MTARRRRENSTTELRAEVPLRIAKLDAPRRLVYAWAHVIRKADGSLPYDVQGDVVDTPSAVNAWEDAFYDFFPAAGTADDMHREFGVAKIVGGLCVTPDLTKALGVPDGTLPTGALIVVRVPRGPRGDKLLADITTGARPMMSIVGSGVREPIEG